MIWQLAAGGAGLGFLKALRDQQNEKGARELAAVTAKYSPWTGMKPQQVKEADFLGSMAEGALGGASLGQNMDMADAYSANTQADTALKTQQALSEQVKAADLEASKRAALESTFATQKANNLKDYGFAVTDAELAQDYEDAPAPKLSSWHPPMALRK